MCRLHTCLSSEPALGMTLPEFAGTQAVLAEAVWLTMAIGKNTICGGWVATLRNMHHVSLIFGHVLPCFAGAAATKKYLDPKPRPTSETTSSGACKGKRIHVRCIFQFLTSKRMYISNESKNETPRNLRGTEFLQTSKGAPHQGRAPASTASDLGRRRLAKELGMPLGVQCITNKILPEISTNSFK